MSRERLTADLSLWEWATVTFLYDPEDAATQADPFLVYQRLRDEFPVYHQPRLRFFALSRFVDVHAALIDHQTYCSRQGLTWDPGAASQAGVLPMMVTTDPPAHTKLRALINRGLTPRRVAALEPAIRSAVTQAIDSLCDGGGGDLVGDIAAPLPTAIIGKFLGVPVAERARFHSWANAVVSGTSGAAYHAEHHRAAGELYGYFRQLIQHYRQQPGDDLISSLVAAEIDGSRLSDEDILGFCFNLIVGGIETTTNLLTNGMVLLQMHPDVRRQLIAEPGRIPQAIEEFLRLESPVQGLCRTTTRAVVLHGVTIPAGEKVLLLFAAANRDEREFRDPDRVDLNRDAKRHLAFGYGAHFCIGASLARLMARVAFEELTTRLGTLRIDVAQGRRNGAAVSRGWAELPVALNGANRPG